MEVSATGYAKEMGEDYKVREAQLYADQCAEVDIIITTALIPGRPAPRIITGEMVASMKPGSVIVDMAAANGGNVEGTVAGEKIVTPTVSRSSATPIWRAAWRRRPASSTARTWST